MSNHRVLLQPAYLLHQRPYRDTSGLLEMFTPEYGRVGIVANGINRAKSNLKGLIQPFYPLLISWSGRGDLFTLNAAEAQGRAIILQQPYLASGIYINELVMRLTQRRESQVELFSAYDQLLRQFQNLHQNIQNTYELQSVLRQFELQLLRNLGYGLLLHREAKTNESVNSTQFYDYQLELGPVKLSRPDDQDIYGIKISGKALLALANDEMILNVKEPRIFNEAKQLMRFVLDRYLGDKPLMSRQLLVKPAIALSSNS